MKVFMLPDLGEGLPDAEIVEWHVAPGDAVSEGQTLVTVETAKAMIDIPSPRAESGALATFSGCALAGCFCTAFFVGAFGGSFFSGLGLGFRASGSGFPPSRSPKASTCKAG